MCICDSELCYLTEHRVYFEHLVLVVINHQVNISYCVVYDFGQPGIKLTSSVVPLQDANNTYAYL